MSKEPKKDVNATIDLLEVVVKSHWIACACDVAWMQSSHCLVDSAFERKDR